MADNVTRNRAAQPKHRRRDFFGVGLRARGNAVFHCGINLRTSVDDIAGNLRINQTRIHCVHANYAKCFFKKLMTLFLISSTSYIAPKCGASFTMINSLGTPTA